MLTIAKTKSEKARRAVVAITLTMSRTALDAFISGEHERCIRILNSVRPIHVAEFLMGRDLTTEEKSQYLNALSGVPDELASAFELAKTWQDVKQACRKSLQKRNRDKDSLVKDFRAFLHTLEYRVT
jgi:protein-disulfide isomerase-like protein with CxxC motif